jgi:hypothetical protein
MAAILTPEQIKLVQQLERQKVLHKTAQKKYRDSKPDYKEKQHQYNQNRKKKIEELKKVLVKVEPKTIDVSSFVPDKRTHRGKKQATDITPSYLQRKEPLTLSTIDEYLRKANVLHNLFTKKPLPQPIKDELKKLFNDSPNVNEKLILDEMNYINDDIEPTIQKLRSHYHNDSSFSNYINILTVITSHFKDLKSTYQILAKINIKTNQDIQTIRADNLVAKEDEDKVINLDRDTIIKNLKKLTNITDMLIYGVYTLFPARRLEWRNVRITTEKNPDKLKDEDTNFLIVSTTPKQIIFNNHKTSKTYGHQVFTIEDEMLDALIDKYIAINGLSNEDYLFSLQRNKKEVINEANFSNKVGSVFKKIYSIPITIRFLRISWCTYIHSQNLSVNELKRYAYMMAHSTSESTMYKKINKT